MTPIVFPDYSGHGIVNLVQSIATACGGRPARYPELAALPGAALADARHVLLLVIDGLGQRALATHPHCPNLRRHALATMSSVFPSTTASAITTFMTGLAPAQHGLTGWHIELDEIGQTLAILPLCPRVGSLPPAISAASLAPRLFDYPPLFSPLARESWALAPNSIADSPFNVWHTRGARRVAYATLPELFARLADLLRDAPCARYVYAYVADLDAAAHRYGSDSEAARQTLAEIDALFGDLLAAARGSDSWLIATADHGFIDSPAERVLHLDDHPQLAALLARPLSGERRAAYCRVVAGRQAEFAGYVRQRLAHCIDLRVSADLIAAGCFGPPPFHHQLAARVGDYTLLMKENWTIVDRLPGEKTHRLIGVHGGVSADEMIVPLIAARL